MQACHGRRFPVAEKLADQPRDHSEFIFSDEQNQLRAAVRKFCADNYDEQTVRQSDGVRSAVRRQGVGAAGR